ncbi:uncharacterized protein TA07080 [Theileria annulata]|nr:uncharacterized protein TA07080 [Theileria annulata]CAI76225.1 hypothetical protein, conserved [Theileria annulata]|eukprot:XP_952850.1 hypothetical protein, conserved [Theileria annulata]
MNKIIFLSILGNNDENIFNCKFEQVDESEMQFSIFASIDIIKQLLSEQISMDYSIIDPYLGFICPTIGSNFFKIYSYITATCLKFILILNDTNLNSNTIRHVLL